MAFYKYNGKSTTDILNIFGVNNVDQTPSGFLTTGDDCDCNRPNGYPLGTQCDVFCRSRYPNQFLVNNGSGDISFKILTSNPTYFGILTEAIKYYDNLVQSTNIGVGKFYGYIPTNTDRTTPGIVEVNSLTKNSIVTSIGNNLTSELSGVDFVNLLNFQPYVDFRPDQLMRLDLELIPIGSGAGVPPGAYDGGDIVVYIGDYDNPSNGSIIYTIPADVLTSLNPSVSLYKSIFVPLTTDIFTLPNNCKNYYFKMTNPTTLFTGLITFNIGFTNNDGPLNSSSSCTTDCVNNLRLKYNATTKKYECKACERGDFDGDGIITTRDL